jgi:hypothetical protein
MEVNMLTTNLQLTTLHKAFKMQHIVPYTPQQNGVAKRKNHTLKEMTNCMIQSKGLSPHFWVEAINCENYIVNHTPTKDLKDITPKEAWSKIKPRCKPLSCVW